MHHWCLAARRFVFPVLVVVHVDAVAWAVAATEHPNSDRVEGVVLGAEQSVLQYDVAVATLFVGVVLDGTLLLALAL